MRIGTPGRLTVAALAIAGLLAGCSGTEREYDYPDTLFERGPAPPEGGLFTGDGFFDLFDNNQGEAAAAAPGIGVNSYLWRATLDTVSFMPVTSADPFGGVVITDWYAPDERPDERFKLNVYILDRQLRADGIRVAVFRQTREQEGPWLDAPVDAETATTIEDAILTRARELRIADTSTS